MHDDATVDPADIENELRREFELTLAARVRRRGEVERLRRPIPDASLAAAAAECADAFVAGLFYSCITQTQALIEALAKFVAAKNGLAKTDSHAGLIQRLHDHGAIGPATFEAFRSIRGGKGSGERNAFRHLDVSIEQSPDALESRAGDCLLALSEIVSDIFATSSGAGGASVPKHPEYWPEGQKRGEAAAGVK